MATNNDLGNMIINVSLDDSQFTNGMDNINRSLKTSKSAMRAHISQLEAVGDHLGALEANLEGLNTQYTLNQRKQEELNRKYQQAVQTYGAASDQAQKYARKINDTTRELRALESRMSRVQNEIEDFNNQVDDSRTKLQRFGDGVDKIGGHLDKVSGKLGSFASKMSGPLLGAIGGITGGITGIGAAAVDMAKQVDDSMVKVKNSLDVDEKGAKVVNDQIRDVYKAGYGEDMGEVSDTVITLKQQVDIDDKQVADTTKKLMAVSQTVQEDPAEVIRAMKVLMEEYDLSAEQALDQIATANKMGLNYSHELVDNTAEYARYYKDQGYTVEEMWQRLANMKDAGAYNLDKSNDAVKEFTLRNKEWSEDQAAAFKQLGPEVESLWGAYLRGEVPMKDVQNAAIESLKKIDDATLRNEIGVQLWGTQWEDNGEKVVLAGNDATNAIKDTDGAADETAKNIEESFGNRVKTAFREAQDALLPLGEKLLEITEDILPKFKASVPKIETAMEKVADGIQKGIEWIKNLIGWWNSLDGSTQTWIKRVALAAGGLAAFGIVMSPVAKGLSILLGGVRGTITAFQKVAGVSKTVFGFFSKGANETSKFGSALNKVKGVATGAFNVIKAGGKGLFSVLKLGAKGLFTVLKVGIKGALGPFGLVLTAITLLVEGFKYAYNHSEKFRNIVDKLWAKIKGVWENIKKLNFKGALKSLWNFYKTYWSTIAKFVVGGVKSLTNKVKDLFGKVKTAVVSTVKGLWTGIKTHFSNGINAVKNGVSSFKNKITSTFTAVKNAVVGTVKGLWTGVKTTFTNGIGFVAKKIGGFKDKMLEVFRGIKSKVEEIVDNIIDKVKAMPGKMADGVAKGKKALIDGSKKMLNGAIEGVEWGLNKVVGGANKVLGFFGSDKKIEEVKLKKYAKGTPRGGHEGGLAMVNDGVGSNYKELITTPDGRSFVPEGRNVVMNLPKGSSVLNGEKTRQAMDMGMIPKYATGIGWLDKSFNWAKDKYNKVKDWGSEIWDLATNPSKLKEILANFVDKAIPEKFKNGFLPDLMGATSNKIMDFASKFLFKEKEEADLANDGVGGDFGNWKPFKGNFNKVSNKWGVYDFLYDLGQQIVAKFKGKYKGLHISDGKRKSSMTAAGTVSDHVYGLGLDLARGGVRDNSYYEMAKTLSAHPYLKYVIGSNMWNTGKGGSKFVKYPYAKSSPHDNHLHLSAKNPSNAKKAGANSDSFGVGDYSASGKGAHGVSASGLKFIQSKEGYSPKWYDLGDGMLTIGWGTALSKSQAASKGYKAGGSLPKETLQAMFENEVGKFASQVKSKLNAKGFKVNQNQFDMLVSYAYNRGMGGFNQLLKNSGSVGAMGSNIVKYWGSNTKFYSGLIKRRKEESSIFKNGYEDGGLITREQLAWVGEGNRPEAIIPLDKAKRGRAVKLLKETARVLGVSVNDGTGNSSTGSRSSGGNNNGLLAKLLAATLEQNQLLKQQNELIEKKELVVGDQAIYDSNKRIADKVNRQNNFSYGY